MTRRFTVSQLEQMRRDARKLSRQQSELSHTQVLDRIAQQQGFQNWSLLAKHVEEGGVAAEPVKQRVAHLPFPLVASDGAKPLRMEATRDEMRLIMDIVKRFAELAGDGLGVDRLSLMMDIEACHCNACPLDLDALAHAERDFDLVHDVAGIYRHFNRETGALEDSFRPRYAARGTLRAA